MPVEDGGTRVIVRYPFDGLVLIGIRDRTTGADLPWTEVHAWGTSAGLRVAEAVALDLDEAVARARTLDATAEGFVLRWGDHRVKVKSAAYLAVARLLQGFTERTAADFWYHRAPLPAALSEESRQWTLALWAELDAEVARVDAEVAAMVRDGPADRKALVAHLGTRHPLFDLVMAAAANRRRDSRVWVYKQRFGGNQPRPA